VWFFFRDAEACLSFGGFRGGGFGGGFWGLEGWSCDKIGKRLIWKWRRGLISTVMGG